jgi:hypothetical protein
MMNKAAECGLQTADDGKCISERCSLQTADCHHSIIARSASEVTVSSGSLSPENSLDKRYQDFKRTNNNRFWKKVKTKILYGIIKKYAGVAQG